MAHRYFTKDILSDSARITGPDATHLARVLRTKPGDTLVLCDGNGTDYDAVVDKVTPEEILCTILSSIPSKAEPSLWTDVYIGYAKGDRMELAIQKCVELGASRIIPFFSQNCVAQPKKEESKNERYNRIATEAAKQCGRGILPKVEMPLTFKEVLTQATQCDTALFLYEVGGHPLHSALQQQKHIAIITGAEGGFTPAEAAQADAAGCVTIGLGPRILRCETAPIVTLAAIMAITGNLE